MEKVSGVVMMQRASFLRICSLLGQVRTSNTWCKSILHSRLSEDAYFMCPSRECYLYVYQMQKRISEHVCAPKTCANPLSMLLLLARQCNMWLSGRTAPSGDADWHIIIAFAENAQPSHD